MNHKKEAETLFRELKEIVIRKCTYLNSKKVIIENEAYSLMKLFFKSYLEIEYELSFVDLISKVNDLNINSELKEKTTSFLNNLSENLYSGKSFSQEELHSIIRNFQIIVDSLIKEKREQSLVDKSMKRVIKLPFIKRLFIRKKGVILKEKPKHEEKVYSSLREKLIDKIKDIAKEEDVVETKTIKSTVGEKLADNIVQEKAPAQVIDSDKNIVKQTKEVIPEQEKVGVTDIPMYIWTSSVSTEKYNKEIEVKPEYKPNFVQEPGAYYDADLGMFEEVSQSQKAFALVADIDDKTPEVKPKPKLEPKSVIKPEVKPKLEPKSVIKPEVKPKPKPVIKPEVKSKPLSSFTKLSEEELSKFDKEKSKVLLNLINTEKILGTLNKHINSVDTAKKKEILKKLIKIELMENRLSKNLDTVIKKQPVKFDDTHIDKYLDKKITDKNVATKMNNYFNKMKKKKVMLLEIVNPSKRKLKSKDVKSFPSEGIIRIDEPIYDTIMAETKAFLNSNSKRSSTKLNSSSKNHKLNRKGKKNGKK